MTIVSEQELAASVDSTPQAPPAAHLDEDKQGYAQILKSSALIGGSQAVNIGIGVVRTKAMALLLGPGGFGLAGVYQSIIDLTQNIAELGVNSSGVRQIAEAVGSGDQDRIARTVAVLRRTSVVLGVLGAALLILLSPSISIVTFGDRHRALPISFLGAAILFRIVSAGQGALLNGVRRIRDLAKMQIFGAGLGVFLGVPIIYVLREKGIPLYLIAVAASSMAISWWYSRRVPVVPPKLTLSTVATETSALLKLGIAFMLSGMMTMGVAYVVRVILLHKNGIAATGLYQSAWNLGGVYVGFILQAMGADFYPHLTANIRNHAICNRLVNQQARIGLLLATPGVLATLSLAHAVVAILYTRGFSASVPVLRWICLGATLQVVSWPMGFIIIAKGRQNLFIFSEVSWAVVSLTLAWICIAQFGIVGAGIAFFISYIFHWVLTYAIVRRLTSFRWSPENCRSMTVFLLLIATVFSGFYVFPPSVAVAVGLAAAAGAAVYCGRKLLMIVPFEDLPKAFRAIIGFTRCA